MLVCWHSDRVERRGPEALFRLLRDQGCRRQIESTKEPLLGTEDLSGEAVTAINAVIAHQESVQKTERQLISIASLKANGSVFNNVPWGFNIVGPKYSKTIEPTEQCRVIVPQIFARCIAGDSLRSIAAWLTAEGIATPRGKAQWNESTVRWILKSRAYAGRLQTRKGETVARCEAVITADVFDRANAALKTRPQRGPSTGNPSMLAKLSVRVAAHLCTESRQAALTSASITVARVVVRSARVAAHGARRTPRHDGCRSHAQLEHLPYQTREWVEGQNWDEPIAEVKQDIREAADAERFDEMPALQAKLAELRSRKACQDTTSCATQTRALVNTSTI